jgi:hypothetical protein
MRTSSFLPVFLLAAAAVAQGTTCFSGPAAGTFLGNAADTIYTAQPIGFAFPFGGATYTDVHVSDHGIVFLSNGGVPTPPAATPFVYTPSLANFATGGPKIAAMWSDTVGGSLTPGAGVYVNSTATECRIEWRSVFSFGVPTSEFNLAMTLSVTGQVQFDYGTGVTNNSTFGGVSDNGIVGMFAGGTLPASLDLSTTGASVDNNTFENFVVANTFDMANNRLLMIPSAPGWSYVLLGPSAGCASATSFGAGCGGALSSIYERFLTTPSIDLSNRSIRMFNNGSGYGVLPNAGTPFLAPSASAINLGLGDDTEGIVTLSAPFSFPGGTTTSLTVGSNGHVATASNGAAGDYTPTEGEFLGWTNPTWAVWRDFICNASGNVKFEEVGGVAYITWDNVIGYQGTTPGTTPSTFQFQFYLASGDVAFVFQSMDTVSINGFAGAEGWIVGYSGPGAGLDPGSVDLSTSSLIAINGFDFPSLALANNGLPTVGNAAFGYTVSYVQPLLPLAFVFFGTAAVNPGIPLAAIGMPGCFSYSTADLGSLTAPVVAGTGTLPFAIPANPALVSASLTAQALAFSLVTPLNLVSSNGNSITVGF